MIQIKKNNIFKVFQEIFMKFFIIIMKINIISYTLQEESKKINKEKQLNFFFFKVLQC